VRLDHLLSKESLARSSSVHLVRGGLVSGKLLRRALAIRRIGDVRPRRPLAGGTTGRRSAGHRCSVLREPHRRRRRRRRATRSRSAKRVATRPAPRPQPGTSVTTGGGYCPLRTTERARASRNYSQATKSQRWMPWRQTPMKDVGGCEKPREAADQAVIRGSPNGETRLGSCPVTPA
jgi:hypothetical protein